jgi:hypothetical protein
MKKIFLFCFAFFLFTCGCKNKAHIPYNIKIDNKLGKKIVCVFGYNYPDLSLTFTSKEALLADTNLFQFDSGQIKELDTLGLCKKEVWDKYVTKSLLMLIVFDKKKLVHAKKLEDALLERYYFSYIQAVKDSGVIVVY